MRRPTDSSGAIPRLSVWKMDSANGELTWRRIHPGVEYARSLIVGRESLAREHQRFVVEPYSKLQLLRAQAMRLAYARP
jgi:hypothetical protein